MSSPIAITFAGSAIVMVDMWPPPPPDGPERIGSVPPSQLAYVDPFQKLPDGPTVTPLELELQSDQFERHPMKLRLVVVSRTAPPGPVVQVPLSKVILLKVRELLSERKLFRSVASCPVEDDPVQGFVQAEPNAVNEHAASSKASDR